MATSRKVPVALLTAVVLPLAACTAGDANQVPPTTQGAATSAPNLAHAEVVERLAPSVVTIQAGRGLGSGVVLRQDMVVTNHHVVAERSELTVVYADGDRSPGTVLASDAVTDLAVVRTERGDLPVPDYRTELPRPGERALAIGSPLGFQNSVTAGIISGLHRDIPGSAAQTRSLVDLIQTDAPISPGNSGGALLDEHGQLLGINEAYLPPQTGAVYLGFAIPSATVLDVTEQLIADGTATHPYLGVSPRQLTPAIQQQLGARTDHGAVVTGVDEDGPAATAGVRAGDIITDLAGTEVRTVEDLLTALRQTEPDQSVELTLGRGEEQLRPSVTIGSREP